MFRTNKLALFSLLASVFLWGCTSHIYQEATHPQKKPVDTIFISYTKNQNIQGTLSTVGPPGGGNFQNARELARRDIIRLLESSEAGVKTKLPGLISKGKVIVVADPSKAEGILNIYPESYVVECGNGGSICNASVYFRVSFLNTLEKKEAWRAGFKVGASFGQEQTVEALNPFFEDIASRLRNLKLGNFE